MTAPIAALSLSDLRQFESGLHIYFPEKTNELKNVKDEINRKIYEEDRAQRLKPTTAEKFDLTPNLDQPIGGQPWASYLRAWWQFLRGSSTPSAKSGNCQ